MDLLKGFTGIRDRLYKRETPKDEFNAIFERKDFVRFFSYLMNVYDPSGLTQKFGGRQFLEKLYYDAEIYSAWDKRQSAIFDTRLILNGDNESVKEWFEEQLLPHERQLKQDIQWSIYYGYNVEQIIYDPDRSGNVLGFQREQYWRFDPMPDLLHVVLVNSDVPEMTNKIMPYGKWVLTVNNGTYYNPWGEAMAERLLQPWLWRCTDWELLIQFARKFANGFMVGKTPNPDDVKQFGEMLQTAQKGGTITYSGDAEVNLLQPNRDSNIYKMINDECVAMFQKVILGEVLTSQPGESGSYALGSVQNDVRLEKFLNDKSFVEGGINEIIRQIGYVNGIDSKDLPKAELTIETGLNNELAARDQLLSGQVKFTKKYYIDKYGFEEDDFEVKEDQPVSGFFKADQKKSLYLKKEDVEAYLGADKNCKDCNLPVNLAPSITRKENRQDQEKEDAVSFLTRHGDEPLSIDDIIAAIQTSENEKDLDEKLMSLFGQDSPEVIDTLTNTLYYAASKGALYGNPKKVESDGD